MDSEPGCKINCWPQFYAFMKIRSQLYEIFDSSLSINYLKYITPDIYIYLLYCRMTLLYYNYMTPGVEIAVRVILVLFADLFTF